MRYEVKTILNSRSIIFWIIFLKVKTNFEDQHYFEFPFRVVIDGVALALPQLISKCAHGFTYAVQFALIIVSTCWNKTLQNYYPSSVPDSAIATRIYVVHDVLGGERSNRASTLSRRCSIVVVKELGPSNSTISMHASSPTGDE